MLKVSKKSTFSRVGILCAITFGMTVMSCTPERVVPQVRTSGENGQPAPFIRTDSIKVNDDQPPKDVGNGSKGNSHYFPADSIRVNDDQPPKDVGNGSKGNA